jgi:hypothetical protein
MQVSPLPRRSTKGMSDADKAKRARMGEIRNQRGALHTLTSNPKPSPNNPNAERPVDSLELVERLADAALYCMDVEDWQVRLSHPSLRCGYSYPRTCVGLMHMTRCSGWSPPPTTTTATITSQ